MKRKIILLVVSWLMVAALLLVSCGPAAEEEEEVLIEEEVATEEDSKAHIDIEASISGWIPGNADNISQAIAALIPADIAIARGVIARMIKTALLTKLEFSVEHTEPIEGEDRYSARVNLGFPILLKLPVLGEKDYWISIGYDLVIENGQVVDANIDFSSFEMTESTT